ncbi:MAG: hypothetical protein AMS16_04115, partial [Planctomycetes bacterium DG_58]
MKPRTVITLAIVLLAVVYLGWKIYDLRWNRPPELKEHYSRFRYADTFQHVRDNVYPNVLRHARQIGAFGSRQTGQRGCELTVQYVRSQLEAIGFDNVTGKAYTVTVPVEKTCSVVVEKGGPAGGDTAYEAHTMIPNCVETSPTPDGGIRGELVYLGFGTVEEWTGRDVRGRVVVLEFNSADAWLKAVSRGAAAVIFLEPTQTCVRETDRKYIDMLPLRATRVYVWGKAARELRQAAKAGGKTARVMSRQTLEVVSAPYLEVTVPGTGKSPKTIILTCHMDARSIVPAMSYGGDELWGVCVWLELARWFKERPPENNVRFVAFTGHWQDFTGSRNYVSEHLDEVGREVPVVFGLDFSTEEEWLSLVPDGWPQRGAWRGGSRWLERLIWSFTAEPRQNWIEDIKRETGRRVQMHGDAPPGHPWIHTAVGPERLHNPASLVGRYYASSEAWLSVGGQSGVWQTARLHRQHHNTPLDTFDVSYARHKNLPSQLELLFAFIDNIMEIKGIYFPRRTAHKVSAKSTGYLEFHGQIKRYDEKTAWYKGGLPPDPYDAPLPNTFIYMYPFDIRSRRFQTTVSSWHPLAPEKQKHRGLQSRGVRYLAKVDEEGRFEFKTVYYQSRFTRYTFMAFSLDEAGNILYASDLGRHGADEFKYLVRAAENWTIDQSVTVFPCGSVTLFDLFDRKRYSIGSNIKDTWFIQWGTGNQQAQDAGQECYMPVSEVKLYPSQTDAKSYLITQYQKTAMVFLPAGKTCEILLTRGPLKKFSLVRSLDPALAPKVSIRDLFDEEPSFRDTATLPLKMAVDRKLMEKTARAVPERLTGITLEQGEEHHLQDTSLTLARQMHRIDAEKLEHYAQFGVKSQEADDYFDNATVYIARAEKALEERDEPKYESTSIMAWRSESRAYQGRFRLLYDVVSTTIFYFTLLIPFSYLMERLLFPQTTYVRSASVAGVVFVVFVLLLLRFHPGFDLAGNIYVAIVSFLIIVFTLPAFFMIVGQGLKMLKAAGTQYFQRHASEAERLGVLVAALSLSIANMRRRRLRTGLTLGTISLLVLSLVLLTHTTSTSRTYPTAEPPKSEVIPYEGIQIYNTHHHVHALFRELVELTENTYKDRALVIPRWYVHYGVGTNLKGFESLRLYGNYKEQEFSIYDLLAHVPSFWETTTFPLKILNDAKLTAKVIEAAERPDPWVDIPTIQFAHPEETKVTHIDKTMISGRWFEPGDVEAVIISDITAESLGAKVGDTLEIEDFRVKLVGVFGTKRRDVSVYDLLDHEPTFHEIVTFPLRVLGDPQLMAKAVKHLWQPILMDDMKDLTGDSILPIRFEQNQPTP